MKKTVALILSLLMLGLSLAFPLGAEAAAAIADVEAQRGETVAVMVSVSGLNAFKSMAVTPIYDGDVLSVSSVSWLTSGWSDDDQEKIQIKNWSASENLAAIALSDTVEFSGSILKISFLVKASAPYEKTAVSCEMTVCYDHDPVTVPVTAGGITVNVAFAGDYTMSDGAAVITGLDGGEGCRVLPPSVGTGLPVTGIGGSILNGNTDVDGVVIPESVVSISAAAFAGSQVRYTYFVGDAPMVSGTAAGANPLGVTVYYRAGASGWDASEWSNAAAITPGDIGGNGDVGMTDAVAFLQKLVQGNGATYTDAEFLAADVVRDGALGMTDIVRLLRSFVDTTIVLK